MLQNENLFVKSATTLPRISLLKFVKCHAQPAVVTNWQWKKPSAAARDAERDPPGCFTYDLKEANK